MADLVPDSAKALTGIVSDFVGAGRRLELQGGGSKAGIRANTVDAAILDMSAIAGVVDYDPAELTLTVRPGTRLAELQALVDGQGQMLAFEPFDHGPLLGGIAGKSTIGGIMAAGVAGSRRLSAGGARDHLLRVEAVSGRGEIFVAGAKVVKNVTGYDVPKLICGSWGRLAAITEMTIKVMPRPEATLTLVFQGLAPAEAGRVMLAALGSTASVAAVAYLPLWQGRPTTGLRLEGVEPSIRARTDTLSALLGQHGAFEQLDAGGESAFWSELRYGPSLAGTDALWRIHLPARAWSGFVAALPESDFRWMVDWGGNLLWLASDAPAGLVRGTAAKAGGHAMLIRRSAAVASEPVFQPPSAGVGNLESRLRRAFDPVGVFETGRFGDGHAD